MTAASTWETWINLQIDNRIYTVITGLFYIENAINITAVQFQANGEVLPVIDIEELQAYQVSNVWLEKPIIIKPGNNFQAFYVAKNTKTAAENLGLMGYTIAKRAYLINQ